MPHLFFICRKMYNLYFFNTVIHKCDSNTIINTHKTIRHDEKIHPAMKSLAPLKIGAIK